jgi:Flp pilus assembly protein TadD
MEGMIMGKNSNKPIPLEIQVLNRQAMEMSSHGNYPDALKIFSQVVFIAPHFAKAQYEMGRCLDSLGRSNEAVERYDKARRLDSLFIQGLTLTYSL